MYLLTFTLSSTHNHTVTSLCSWLVSWYQQMGSSTVNASLFFSSSHLWKRNVIYHFSYFLKFNVDVIYVCLFILLCLSLFGFVFHCVVGSIQVDKQRCTGKLHQFIKWIYKPSNYKPINYLYNIMCHFKERISNLVSALIISTDTYILYIFWQKAKHVCTPDLISYSYSLNNVQCFILWTNSSSISSKVLSTLWTWKSNVLHCISFTPFVFNVAYIKNLLTHVSYNIRLCSRLQKCRV